MMDPTKEPGIQFVGVRLKRATYELGPDPDDQANAELVYRYDDEIEVDGRSILVRQNLHCRILGRSEPKTIHLQASIQVEGRFHASSDPNVKPRDFAENHAPAILFAFTREWMHRLTSSAGAWPPILIPPVNVLEMRKRQVPAPE